MFLCYPIDGGFWHQGLERIRGKKGDFDIKLLKRYNAFFEASYTQLKREDPRKDNCL